MGCGVWGGAGLGEGILGSEAFKTSPDSYLTEDDLKKVIVGLEATFIKVNLGSRAGG